MCGGRRGALGSAGTGSFGTLLAVKGQARRQPSRAGPDPVTYTRTLDIEEYYDDIGNCVGTLVNMGATL